MSSCSFMAQPITAFRDKMAVASMLRLLHGPKGKPKLRKLYRHQTSAEIRGDAHFAVVAVAKILSKQPHAGAAGGPIRR